jgi:hypothetical protein
MNEPKSNGERVVTVIVGAAFLILTWWKRRRQFAQAIASTKVYVNDTPLRCQICEGERFRKREALVNTTWMTLFKLDPLNESAHCLTCLRCGYAHWFMRREFGEHPNTWIRYEILPAQLPRDNQT